MPIEMPKGLPFSVDTWTPSSKQKRHHFLTHAHKDHSAGISAHSSFPIYSTGLTKTLILHQFPQLDSSLFICIEVGDTLIIQDPDGNFSVTAFDANHCPGASMFLFEGSFGNILHTGDCRLTPECLQNLPAKYIGKKGKEPKRHLDYLFLDCTFGSSSIKIPSKYSAIQQVINCIWKHPNTPVVYFTCDLLAQDEILLEVSKTFGSKIFVNRLTNVECFQALTVIAPDILSEDESSRFQLFDGFAKFYERARTKLAEARAKGEPEPLFIRPSALWYVFEEDSKTESQQKHMPSGAKKDSFGVWHVCYSSHSSRDELEWALQLLQPRRVVSTTPSCRAMELDYVKKHCIKTQVTHDDPLWKLMDINTQDESISARAPILPDVTAICVVSPLRTKELRVSFEEAGQFTSTNKSSCSRTEYSLNLSPPSTRPPVTLFGRARMAIEDSSILQEHKRPLPVKIDSPCEHISKSEEHDSVVQANSSYSLPGKSEEQGSVLQDVGKVETQCSHSMEKKIQIVNSPVHSCVGSSRSFNESLRKMYSSMNVPVPRPLPSLMELMNRTKRAKRSFQF